MNKMTAGVRRTEMHQRRWLSREEDCWRAEDEEAVAPPLNDLLLRRGLRLPPLSAPTPVGQKPPQPCLKGGKFTFVLFPLNDGMVPIKFSQGRRLEFRCS